MPDALDAAIDLMEADPAKLIHRNAFNVTAMSFDPEIIAASIRKYIRLWFCGKVHGGIVCNPMVQP